MKLEKRFLSIQNLLHSHQYLHEKEVLERYPRIINPYHEWVAAIAPLPPQKRLALENNYTADESLPMDYREFLEQVKALVAIPKETSSPQSLPKAWLQKVTEKKRHEISHILPLMEKDDFFVDIGSGAAHLSQFLLLGNQKMSLCIDQDPEVQLIGKKKIKGTELENRLQFETCHVNAQTQVKLDQPATLVGLHACGDLSVDLMKLFKNQSMIKFLNFPCCYHKLSQLNLSSVAQANPVDLTNHSLTMATKSYKTIGIKEDDQRKLVKRYRYTLHMLMNEEFDIAFQTLGNAPKADYQGDFATYCYHQFPESKKFNRDWLQTYFEKKVSAVDQYLCYGVVRSHLSRLVELYIILDRALYMQEQGFEVEIKEVFDPAISPRNIAMTVYSKEA